MTPAGPFTPSWLCPTPADRERVVDMEHRLKPVRTLTFAVMALVLIGAGKWVGWWTLVPLAIATVGFAVVDRGLEDSSLPERRISIAWVLSVGLVSASIALTGGPASPALPWLAIPTVTLPARFGVHGIAAGAVATIVALLSVTFGVDPAATLENPATVIFTFGLIVSVMALSVALMRSDLHHRSESVIDPLTGMLNRSALKSRVAELAAQASVNRQPVALVVADLDHFKEVNDTQGHTVGDAVLQEVAYRVRAKLRAYDLAYRLGGEEFLVVLPGATAPQAFEIAETLRQAIEVSPVAGVPVTMSFGVSASPSEAFDYEQVFAEADEALYAAKNDGRNRVRCARCDMPAPQAQRLSAA